ncbi:hypothetical protein [Neptunicoccus cionae]|uniref:DNA alkylation repair protein n=1 Tax=Neptunicoccus cionae TaxID=2035344 RepID=A0A916VQL0_9RHOB|nr:hypothetical protein [Amylibacter cionae]GGA22034.1 hypothetical protein GCM10011498_23460 [Amylibacter cionae]
MTQAQFSLKDALFNEAKVEYLGGLLARADSRFDRAGFQRDVMALLPELELKQRIDHIAQVLTSYLPEEFDGAAATIERALPPELDPHKSDDDFGDFIFAPLGAFVATQGINQPERALETLAAITKRFSMEYAIRDFINAHETLVMKVMQEWAQADNYHLRRLVSEGTRPRLPWGRKIVLDHHTPLALLDRLYCDPTRYVTRSVANHLNDIAKIDPDLVLSRLERWQVEGRQTGKEMDWITRHALRGLIKQGHRGAMEHLGYQVDPPIVDPELRVLTPDVGIGEALEFEATLRAVVDTNLMVDYVLEFLKADGSHRVKVFKLKQVTLKAGQVVSLRKRHRLRGDATTYRLVAGVQRVKLQVNGVLRGAEEFVLTQA